MFDDLRECVWWRRPLSASAAAVRPLQGEGRRGPLSSMESQIQILVELSEADRECHRVRDRVQNIPRELARHESEVKLKRASLDDLERRLEDSQRERRALERDSDLAKARRRELEAQQFRVKNTTEYQAMSREAEEMRRRSAEYEDRGLVILQEEEQLTAEVAKLRDLLAQEEKRFAEVKARLDAELGERREALQGRESHRVALVAKLEPPIRKRYERILENKGDLAVASVENGSCGGCYYQLPPQRLHEVKKAASLVVCEGCGRIVVWSKP